MYKGSEKGEGEQMADTQYAQACIGRGRQIEQREGLRERESFSSCCFALVTIII